MSGIMLNLAGGSFAPSVPTIIGQAFGGGFYAGQISTAGNSIADYYLIVGPIASAQSTLAWKTSSTGGDPTSVIDGPTNSATMNSATYPAAQFCEGLTIGGQTDWYMPAKNELEVCYYNLKPSITSNNTNSGTNTNAVPSRGSNYTVGTPAQTSAADFVTITGAEAFANGGYYWASTQRPVTSRGWVQDFSGGYQYGYVKSNAAFVRAVRRIAV